MPARNSSMELSSPTNAEVDVGRRKSGRVVKPPKYLSPSISSAKRKRDATADQDAGSSSDGTSDGSSAEEPDDRQAVRKRKHLRGANATVATKRSKTNGISATLPLRSAAAKPKKAKKGARLTNAGAGGLYGQIFGAEDTLDDVAALWLDRFKQHQSNALTEVVNLLLRCSGCRIEVGAYDIEDVDNAANKLTEIQEEYQAQNITEYPLIARSKSAATFKRTLTGFFDSLLKSIAASNVLYNEPDLIENIEVWVACLSSAANRPFRHTATIVAFSIISAMCESAKTLVDNRATLIRQVDGEKKRSKVNKKRVQDLQAEAEQAQQTLEQLNSVIRDWYDTIFVHRYRDVIPAIRVDSVIYLTDWIMTYADEFLDGAHLRYLGWLLADEDKSTRHEVVKQLQRIYSDDNKIAGLHQFTERFRSRMIEMATRDKETSVRASAVELLEILRHAGLLEPDDIDTIGRLVYDAEPLVRKAVVPFVVASIDEILMSKLDDLGGQEALEEGMVAGDDGEFQLARKEWLTFKTLAELLQSFDPEGADATQGKSHSNDVLVAAPTEVESRFSFATEAIFERFTDLGKWEILAGYLLFDHSRSSGATDTVGFESEFKEKCKLSDKEEIILLDVLNTSVKLSLTEAVEEGKEKKSKISKKQAELSLEKQERAAQRLAVIIPKLLNKFGAAAEAASAVLRLERMLNLEVFQELQQDSTTFAALLDDVKKQFMTHDDSSVLTQVSAALNHANSYDGLGEITAEKLQTLWDDSTYALVSHCRGEDLTVRGGMDNAVLAAVAGTMLRISSLGRISSCVDALETPKKYAPPKAQRKQHKDPPVAPINLIIPMLGRGRPSSHVDPEVDEVEDGLVLSVIQSILYYFLWQIHTLQKSQPSSSASGRPNLTTLEERRDAVCDQLNYIISERHGSDAVRVAAAELLLDLHTILVDRRAGTGSSVTGLIEGEELSPKQQANILRVLAAAEKDFASKSNRKLEGPGEDDDPEDLSDDEESDDSSVISVENGTQENDETAQRRRARATQKQKDLLVAEYRLCGFAAKIVRAIISGVVDRAPDGTTMASHEGPVRRRLVKNKARLGPNFKGVIEALERGGLPKETAADAKKARGDKAHHSISAAARGPGVKKAKSREIVEDESDEDADADVRMGDEIEDDDEDVLRRNGLVVDEGPDEPEDEARNGRGESEVESVLGD